METTPQSLLISHVIVSYSDNNHHNHYGMQNTIDWVAYKQQKFISCSPGSWKFKTTARVDLVSDESQLPHYWCLLIITFHGGSDEGLLSSCF